ncbi:hypothetical protein [Pseudomonas syringae]|uniref:hypothetical protein n=1 Tax=Pseudomonas syringae TaxID=317 RepID=UPI00404138A7
MFAKNTHALRQKQTVIPQLLAAGRRSELVREKHSHALRQKQTVIPSFWPQAVGANLFAKNAHALRQKQTVIPQLLAAGRRSELVREKHSHALRQKQTVIPQLLAAGRRANLFAKNTLTPYGRSKP